MSVSFNQIPVDMRTPGQYVEFDNSRALQGLPGMPHRILVIGQRLTTGTVAEGVPTQITRDAQAEQMPGRGSMAHHMLKALRGANPYTETWAVFLDDAGAGVQAANTITVTGTATAAGTIQLYIGGQRVRVAVASGDNQDAVAASIVAAINAQTDLPVTALVDGVNANEVDITARHKGESGNAIDVKVNYFQGEALPSGVTLAITAMAGGASNPDISTALTAIGDEQYHTIVMPYTDAANLLALETELASRWGPLVMKEGHAFACAAGTHSIINTLGDSRNSEHLTIMGAQKSPTAPWVIAAVVGAVDAFEPDPARPRQTLKLPGVLAPLQPDRYTRAERDLHLHDGISTYMVDSGGNAIIERLITTYQTNGFGIDDVSYLDLTTMRTLAYLRYSVRARIGLKFPRHKLANDGTKFGAGQAIVTPSTIRVELIALFREWEEVGLAENVEQFKTDLVVERDGTDVNRINALIPPDLVNQLRVFAGQIQFRL